ncbi:MAG: hypothetical protein WBG46_07285 [Nonlabens sp.]
MKKLLIVCFAALIISCGSKKGAFENMNKTIDEDELKGKWTVSDISFDGYREYKVNLFNDSNTNCFLVSDWSLVANNNRGNYEITNNSCATGKRFFIWKIDPETQKFILKPTDDSYNSESGTGYSLDIKSVSPNQFILQQTLQIDGGPVNMQIKFIKTTLR